MESLFTDKDAWSGGSYELCLELVDRERETLDRMLKAIWELPQFEGFYAHRNVEPCTVPQKLDTKIMFFV